VPLIALLALLTACGGDDKPSAAAPAEPTLTPFPSIDRGDLDNGSSYASRKFKPALTLTIPRRASRTRRAPKTRTMWSSSLSLCGRSRARASASTT
jgi:hypothetical protein